MKSKKSLKTHTCIGMNNMRLLGLKVLKLTTEMYVRLYLLQITKTCVLKIIQLRKAHATNILYFRFLNLF